MLLTTALNLRIVPPLVAILCMQWKAGPVTMRTVLARHKVIRLCFRRGWKSIGERKAVLLVRTRARSVGPCDRIILRYCLSGPLTGLITLVGLGWC